METALSKKAVTNEALSLFLPANNVEKHNKARDRLYKLARLTEIRSNMS